MGDIIELRPGSKDDVLYLKGKCRCLACGHEWEGVSPVGTVDVLECPSCHLLKGAHIGFASPDPVWVCTCGNKLFYATTNCLVCAYCGRSPTFPKGPRRA